MTGNKRHLAFTLAEIMITLIITSVILAATYSIGKQKIDTYDARYMYYSTFMSLKEALADMKANGCTATDVTNLVCQSTSYLPSKGHTADSRGLCDRLADYYNVPGGAGNCSLTNQGNPATQIISTTTPNFTASSGARFYNLNSTSAATTQINIYADIDGPRGTTTNGKDLVCFFADLTTGGIAPCIDGYADVKTDYLSLSVYYMDKATNAKKYVIENVPFCQAACTAYGGNIWGVNFGGSCSLNACGGGGSYTQDTTNCGAGQCEVEVNKPGFFWGK